MLPPGDAFTGNENHHMDVQGKEVTTYEKYGAAQHLWTI